MNGAPAGGQKLPGLQFPICLIPCLDSNFGGVLDRNRLTLSVGVFPGVNSVTVMMGLATTFLAAALPLEVGGKTFPAGTVEVVVFFIP